MPEHSFFVCFFMSTSIMLKKKKKNNNEASNIQEDPDLINMYQFNLREKI